MFQSFEEFFYFPLVLKPVKSLLSSGIVSDHVGSPKLPQVDADRSNRTARQFRKFAGRHRTVLIQVNDELINHWIPQ